MPKANLIVRGLAQVWSLDVDLSHDEITAMRADGVPVGIIVHEEEWEPPKGHPLNQKEGQK